MAWCPKCERRRPTDRRAFAGECPICSSATHAAWCRGPTPRALEVCAWCGEVVFARAHTAETYAALARYEQERRPPPEELADARPEPRGPGGVALALHVVCGVALALAAGYALDSTTFLLRVPRLVVFGAVLGSGAFVYRLPRGAPDD